MLLGQSKPDSDFLTAVESVQGWTRRRFKLAPQAAVLVSQVACRLAGCPPLETVVAFWSEDERRHQFKLYKPIAQVGYDDIGWLICSPASRDSAGSECC
jgi:hypothetical protein